MYKEKPVISIIDPLGKHGGHHYYVDGIARGLVAAGHEVHVYVTALTGAASGGLFEKRVAFGNLYGSEPTALRALRYFFGLVCALWWARWANTKVINLHAFHHGLREIAAIWGARLFGMKVVLTVHDIESFGASRSSWGRQLALAATSGLIFQNKFSKAAFERLNGDKSHVSAIIPHGHYRDAYPVPPSRVEAQRYLGLDGDEFIFLFFGNPREEKGVDLLIRALGPLRGQPGWRLLTAGKMKPAQEDAIRKLVAEVGLVDRIRIDARHIPDEEAAHYYRAANIVVIPYRHIYESGVTIMAMSMERAALVSDLEPLTEKIVQNETGLVFASGKEVALSIALREALRRHAELDGFGLEGFRRVMIGRDWVRVGALLSKFVCEIY